MLQKFLQGVAQEPSTPEGYVFCPDVFCGFIDAYDEQRAYSIMNGKPDSIPSSQRWLSLLEVPKSIQDPATLERRRVISSAVSFASEAIAKAAQAGRLKTFGRAKSGGPMARIDPKYWGLDDPWPRVKLCAFDFANPYNAYGQKCWLFFDEADFHAEVDRVRISLNRPTIFQPKVASQAEAATVAPDLQIAADKGGRPLDSELWANFVAVTAGLAFNREIDPNWTWGQLWNQLADYASSIGVEIPAKTTSTKAMQLAVRWSKRAHSPEGKPLLDADGSSLNG